MERNNFMNRFVPTVAIAAVPTILVLFFLYLMVGVSRIQTDQSDVGGNAVSNCNEKYQHVINAQNLSVAPLLDIHTLCYSIILSQLKIDQEKVIRDNYLFQRNENVVLLYMTVLITLSGVALAGLQLLASYKLASLGRAESLSGGGEITYSTQGVSFKSSVVGLMILAMSFAFFLVFIVYVYSFQYPPDNSKPAAQNAATQPRFNLLPANPPQPPKAPKTLIKATLL
jgi:hypothetical protein